jgi:hypothetical protein
MATRSEKGKIVYLFSLMAMAFVVLCYLSIQQLQKSNDIRLIDEGIENAHNAYLEIFIADVDFFGYELNDEDFYKTGKSVYLERHDSLMNQIHDLFKRSLAEGGIDKHSEALLNDYDSIFKVIILKIKQRGYKDYGMEGTMRTYAHEIENKKLIPMTDYLMLRRHEKDYLLRSENSYVDQFNVLIAGLEAKYKTEPTAGLLKQYANAFHELVALSDMIGLERQANLKAKLNSSTKQLISAIEDLDTKADEATFHSYKQGLIFFSIGVIGIAVLCISLIILVASKL